MKNESEAEDSPDEGISTESKMIKEIPNLKEIFDKIIVTTKQANSSILTIMNLVNILSSSIQGKLFIKNSYLYYLSYSKL